MKYIRASIALVLCSLILCGCQFEQSHAAYGVFIGVNPENMDALYGYDIVVIDAAYYTKADIDTLHQNGCTVYSYLNIGTIETFRESYADYQQYALKPYEDWPDEYWMDVSQVEWQEHIAGLAGSLAQKGVDGFFLDNTDVYYEYPHPEIFDGLVSIINALAQYQKDVIVNGGDFFVTKAFLEPETPLIQISGVNQECVFTNINFEENTLVEQDADTSQYYRTYLEECGEAKLAVYITEYLDNGNETLTNTIENYSSEHNFIFYISSSKALEG